MGTKTKGTKSAGIVKDLRHKIRVIGILELRALYEVEIWRRHEAPKETSFSTLIKLEEFNEDDILYTLLAMSINVGNPYLGLNHASYHDINKIKRVMPEELPLYINWVFKSGHYDEALKGS
jgi:hypothetical protein